MTNPTEFVAVADTTFLFDEAALKQQLLMFSRIATIAPVALLSNTAFENRDFSKMRAWLYGTGMLFELKMDELKRLDADKVKQNFDVMREDVNALLAPSGLTVEDAEAAKGNAEKAAALREKAAQSDLETAFRSLDPEKLFENMQRMTTNMTRMLAAQVRTVQQLDAQAIIADFNSSLDQNTDRVTTQEILKIVLALPVPDEHVYWDQIIEFRNQLDFQREFLNLRKCMAEIAAGSLQPAQIEETIEYLLNRYRQQLELHRINTDTTSLQAFIVSTADVAKKLADFSWSETARNLFTIDRRKLTLMDGESTSAGSEVAYVMAANPSSGAPAHSV